MEEESDVQPVNKTYNTIEPKVIDSLLRARETHSSYLKVETKRVPRRVLHFSDGVIEEFSTDDEAEKEEEERKQREASQQVVDPKTLAWVPWALYLAWMAGTSTLAVCDSIGERLAWWLGITSPKYYYEIQEAKRMKKEEEERLARQDAEMAGWEKRGDEGQVVSSQEIATASIGEQPQERH